MKSLYKHVFFAPNCFRCWVLMFSAVWDAIPFICLKIWVAVSALQSGSLCLLLAVLSFFYSTQKALATACVSSPAYSWPLERPRSTVLSNAKLHWVVQLPLIAPVFKTPAQLNVQISYWMLFWCLLVCRFFLNSLHLSHNQVCSFALVPF